MRGLWGVLALGVLGSAQADGLRALADQAGAIASPAEEEARLDAALGAEIAAALSGLPDIVEARVIVSRDPGDPLAQPLDQPAAPRRARAAIALVTTGPRASADQARRLASGAVPNLSPDDVTVVVTTRPDDRRQPPALASVGPIRVAPGSRGALLAIFGLGAAVIAALAAWVVLLEMKRMRRS